jgi:hypothetical protein
VVNLDATDLANLEYLRSEGPGRLLTPPSVEGHIRQLIAQAAWSLAERTAVLLTERGAT